MNNSPRFVTTLALSLLCVVAVAKQPAEREVGPRVFRCDVRYERHQRRIRLPLVALYKDHGSHLEFVEWGLPGRWEYDYDATGFKSPKFWRPNPNGEMADELTLDECEKLNGLPW